MNKLTKKYTHLSDEIEGEEDKMLLNNFYKEMAILGGVIGGVLLGLWGFLTLVVSTNI